MNYHFVWCPKYRRKVITEKVELRLKELITSISRENGWEIIALETMPDHVHMFIKTPPTVAPNNIIGRTKGTTNRLLRAEFPAEKWYWWIQDTHHVHAQGVDIGRNHWNCLKGHSSVIPAVLISIGISMPQSTSTIKEWKR